MLLGYGAILTVLVGCSLVHADPQITAAARLAPRQTDPSFVGYIYENGGYSDSRSCDYPQVVSTSGGYVQCCSKSGSCPFYTACSSNTLFAAGVSVACDVNAALTCNTALVLSTVGASNQGSYLACWQKTLGSSAFTIVQNIGSATVAATSSGSAATSTGTVTSSGSRATASSATQTGSRSVSSVASSGSASAASTSASVTSSSAEGVYGMSNNGGIIGAAFLLFHAFL